MASKSGRNPTGRAPVAAKTAAPAETTTDNDVFAGLQVVAETAPLPKGTRDTGPNPFLESVLASYGTMGDDGKMVEDKNATAFGAVVPKGSVKRAVYLIRKAARENGLGVRIIEDAPDAQNNVKIRYKAKAKKQSKTSTTTA